MHLPHRPMLIHRSSLAEPAQRSGTATQRRGAAVITAILVLMVFSGFVLAYLAVAVDSKNTTAHQSEEFRVDSSADAVIRLAINDLWGDFEYARRGMRTTLLDFENYLDGLGVPDSAALATPTEFDCLTPLNLPLDAGARVLGGSEVTGLTVIREDVDDGTRLTFTARVRDRPAVLGGGAESDALERTSQHVYVVERTRFQGLDFAMLSNNLNCAFCHLEVDNADRFFNLDQSAYGSFERVKVGSLETFQARHGTGDSRIAGTLYLAGAAVYSDATPIDDWSTLDLKAWGFDANEMIAEDALSGALTLANMSPADAVDPAPLENLYLDYGADPTKLVDGFLPSEFPAVFPDDGGVDPNTGVPLGTGAGNRLVDPEEFAMSTADVSGSLSGGEIHRLAPGSTLSGATDVASALSSGNTTSLTSTTTGNVILQGTAADPILLNGEIAIDGDVVLFGYVKGTGTIKASGNVYLPSDVQYLDDSTVDGDRIYKLSADGTTNGLAIAAGGNILAGDYYSSGSGYTSAAPNSGFSFVWQEVAAFNKLEWIKSQPMLPVSGEDVMNPASFSATNPYYAGPDYVPRYYTFDEDVSEVPLMIGDGYFDPATNIWIGPERATSWSDFSLVIADPSDPSDPLLYNADGTAKAALSTLAPRSDWIDEASLKDMLQTIRAGRDIDAPLTLDAVLYTANSIFGINSSRNDYTNGTMQVNGAVVAADIGLLSGVSLQVNYDKEVASLLDIAYDSQLSLRYLLKTSELQ